MEENTVVAFQNPSDFQEDPLTEVLQAGARKLLAQAVEAEVSVFLGNRGKFYTPHLIAEAGQVTVEKERINTAGVFSKWTSQ